MTPQEALAKLSGQGDSNDFDDGDGPEGCGWFGWSAASDSPDTGVLTVTWQQAGTEKQTFSWSLTPIKSTSTP